MTLTELYKLFLEFPVIVTDSRKAGKRSIFFALKGENFDGNNFAGSAINNGCSYAIVDNPEFVKGDKFILVEDSLKTLQALAHYHRKRFSIPVFALTGTNGKTTTKELITAVLNEKYQVTSTKGNFNNHIGVPLTLLEINKSTQVAVIEIGANHPGEIEMLCQIVCPDMGMITNIGKAHLEGFGSFEGVIKAKSELYRYLAFNKGTVFINIDNPLLTSLQLPEKIIKYGVSTSGDYTGILLSANPFVEMVWKNNNRGTEDYNHITSSIPGRYNFENILASVTVGDYFGVPVNSIKKAIENYRTESLRSHLINSANKNTVLLDAYNANPTSIEATLHDFLSVVAENKIVILGDMLELGSYSREEHKKIYEFLIRNNINAYLIGTCFKNIAGKGIYLCFNDVDDFIEWLKSNPLRSSYILVKGSRKMKLEKAMDYL